MKVELILFLLLSIRINAQEFSFKIYFEDSNSNLDSIEIGYDRNATYGIDSLFSETNIIDSPYVNDLDVRIGDIWYTRFDGGQGDLKTKKQILGPDQYEEVISIDVKSSYFPITARWDRQLFLKDSISFQSTLITSIPPGGWWDVGSPSNLGRVLFKDLDSIEFTSNAENFFPNEYSFLSTDQDTVSLFFFTFADFIGVRNKELSFAENIIVYPNPTDNSLSIKNDTKKNIESVSIQNLTGNIIFQTEETVDLNLNDLLSGIYFLSITFDDHSTLVKKIIKN